LKSALLSRYGKKETESICFWHVRFSGCKDHELRNLPRAGCHRSTTSRHVLFSPLTYSFPTTRLCRSISITGTLDRVSEITGRFPSFLACGFPTCVIQHIDYLSPSATLSSATRLHCVKR
ncbi:unnamed protein product, partial [Scytosiphon promiscuus]